MIALYSASLHTIYLECNDCLKYQGIFKQCIISKARNMHLARLNSNKLMFYSKINTERHKIVYAYR